MWGEKVKFACKVLRTEHAQIPGYPLVKDHCYKDWLSRQAAESVFISKMQGEILNSKSEFHQPPIVTVRREINRGLWLEISGVIAIYFLTFKLFISFGHKNLIYYSNSIFFFNVRQGPKDETCHIYNLYS